MGIEPTTLAWKAKVIPLYDGRCFTFKKIYILYFASQIIFISSPSP